VIAEAIAAVTALGWALAVWIVLLAATVTAAGYTLTVAVWWPCSTAREAVAGALAASRAVRALRDHPEPQKPACARVAHSRPTWAQPDTEEAA
jgi:hypothetical protein